ncbi:glutathione S-transferase N-terminal domain-containing protein [Marinobacteraceae bacterium S3BR75-40.1]
MSRILYDLAAADEHIRFSPFCWRAKLALMHKELAFETRPWRYCEKDRIAFSGQGKVPVLVDGDTTVSDSWAIAIHLEQTYPDNPLFPGGSAQAQTLFFKLWCEQTLHPLVLRTVMKDLFAVLHPDDQPYWRRTREERFGCTLEEAALSAEEGVSRINQALEPVRPVLSRHDFLDGEAPGFADHLLLAVFQWAGAVSSLSLVAADDVVHRWFGTMRARYGL